MIAAPPFFSPVKAFIEAARPRIRRTMREFAEQEIICPPDSPRRGLPFSVDFCPWNGLLLDLYHSPKFYQFWLKAAAQSGKTFLGFCIAVLYHLFEMQEPVIVGVPKIDLAQSIFEERLLPTIERTRYRDLMPVRGSGSRGGKFNAVRFRNGVVLRFLSPGGRMEIASYTARVVAITEVDKFGEGKETSEETDPINQLIARTLAFGQRARVYAECTVTTKEGRIYREVEEKGTGSRIYTPCPHCGQYVTFRREDFRGWQEAKNVIQAKREARLYCPDCGGAWSEEDRLTALRRPVIVHRGQTVTRDGAVEGDPPPTDRLGLTWTSLHSPLLGYADIADAEWHAARSERDSDQRDVLQLRWGEPYEEEHFDLARVTHREVMDHVGQHAAGEIPAGCDVLTAFVDIGLYVCWYVIVAWKKSDASGYVLDYGPLQVPQGREATPNAILTMLRQFRADTLAKGVQGRRIDVIGIDTGAWYEIGYAWTRESGRGYLPCKGMGTGRNLNRWKDRRQNKDCLVGQGWHLVRFPQHGVWLFEWNTDAWKRAVFQGFSAPSAAAGALYLYHDPDEMRHNQFARQITAEYEREDMKEGVGLVRTWVVDKRDNHYLDCMGANRALAGLVGVHAINVNEPKPAAKDRRRVPPEPPRPARPIRARY